MFKEGEALLHRAQMKLGKIWEDNLNETVLSGKIG